MQDINRNFKGEVAANLGRSGDAIEPIRLEDLHKLRDRSRSLAVDPDSAVPLTIAVFVGSLRECEELLRANGASTRTVASYHKFPTIAFGDGAWALEFGGHVIVGREEAVRRLLGNMGADRAAARRPVAEQRKWLESRGVVFEKEAADGDGG
jgi:hypothetical protein